MSAWTTRMRRVLLVVLFALALSPFALVAGYVLRVLIGTPVSQPTFLWAATIAQSGVPLTFGLGLLTVAALAVVLPGRPRVALLVLGFLLAAWWIAVAPGYLPYLFRPTELY